MTEACTSNKDYAEKRKKLVQAIDSLRPVVEDIAKSLYENPELGLQEVFAVSKLTGILESQGFTVEKEIAGMPTAFWPKPETKGRKSHLWLNSMHCPE